MLAFVCKQLSCVLLLLFFFFFSEYLPKTDSISDSVPMFHCGDCDKPFFTWSGLRRHRLKIHTSRKRTDPASPSIKSTGIASDSRPKLKCVDCDKLFFTSSGLRRHRLKMHKSRKKTDPAFDSRSCKDCSSHNAIRKYPYTHAHLPKTEHEKSKSVPKSRSNLNCQECGKYYSRIDELKRRQKSHSNTVTKNHQCERCGKTFRKLSYLEDHMRKHLGLKLYCSRCSKSYWTKTSLYRHKRSCSDNAIKSFQCNLCDYKCFRTDMLKDHISGVHEKSCLHQCHICSEAFRYRSQLYIHIAKHNMTRPSAKF